MITGSAKADDLFGIKNAELRLDSIGGIMTFNGSGTYKGAAATFSGRLISGNNELSIDVLDLAFSEGKDGGRPLKLYTHASLPGVRRYSLSEPEPHPWGGAWLLLDQKAIAVQYGDNGQVPIREYYSNKTGDYYYIPQNNNNNLRTPGEEWNDLGIPFSLNSISPEISFALGTIRNQLSSNLQYATYPTRGLVTGPDRAAISALGFNMDEISDTLYRYGLATRSRVSSSSNTPALTRYSATFDTALFAGSLWDQKAGLTAGTTPALVLIDNTQLRNANYDPLTRHGARFYSLNGLRYDTVAMDGTTVDLANQQSISQMTLALAKDQPVLESQSAGFLLKDGSLPNTSTASQPSYNVNLQFSLKLSDTTALSRLADLGFYLLSESTPGLDTASPSREVIQQYGLQLFQTSPNFDSYIDSSSQQSLFQTSLQLPSANAFRLVALQGQSQRGLLLTSSASSTPDILQFEAPGIGHLVIGITSNPAGLDDYIARDQSLVPAFNLLGISQAVTLRLNLSREATLNNNLGLYRAVDLAGGVLDSLTGDTFYPGDPGYEKVALADDNTRNLPGNLTVAGDRTASHDTRTIFENAVLFPYACSSEGNTYFAFEAANSDHISHFRVIGRNTFGYEDLPASRSDFDYDDAILSLTTQAL